MENQDQQNIRQTESNGHNQQVTNEAINSTNHIPQVPKTDESIRPGSTNQINQSNSTQGISPEQNQQTEAELSPHATKARAFQRSLKEYDPKNNDIQHAEFYNYHDKDYEQHGYL